MRDLVLVGGGHSHVEVLRRFALRPPRARLTVVLDSPVSIYSGMVPGVVAGQYARRDAEIDVRALASRAAARVVEARLAAVDGDARLLELEGAAPLAYDVASLNVGSGPSGLELPGVAPRALPARPMAAFLDRIARPQPVVRRVVVVGGGAGGAELAFALRRRLPACDRPRGSWTPALAQRIPKPGSARAPEGRRLRHQGRLRATGD